MTNSGGHISWIHPSYRDLLIDEVAKDSKLRCRFLRTLSVDGAVLAMSTGGGAKGARRFPFLTEAEDLELFSKRLTELAQDCAVKSATVLLQALSTAAADPHVAWRDAGLRQLIHDLCENLARRWEQQALELDAHTIESYARASALGRPLPRFLALEATWTKALRAAEDAVSNELTSALYDLEELAQIAQLAFDNEPRYYRRTGFPENHAKLIEACLGLVDLEEVDTSSMEPYEISREAEDREVSSSSLSELAAVFAHLGSTDLAETCEGLESQLDEVVDELRREIRSRENEDEVDYEASPVVEFDIDAFFSDL